MCGHVGDLDEHCGDQVHALQQLQVDVHVERHLTLLLNLLLLLGAFVLALGGKWGGSHYLENKTFFF